LEGKPFDDPFGTDARDQGCPAISTPGSYTFAMTYRSHRIWILLCALPIVCSLGGCGSINSHLAAGMGDAIPQWAGGLPADAPPRPGTAQYDETMKERERERLTPKAKDTTAPSSNSDAMVAIH
jgi:hypothetical protein